MAYYDALIAKWATLSPGTTDQKLAQINALTVASPAKAIVTPSAVLNSVVPADLAALTSAQVAMLTLILQGSSIDASVGTTIRAAAQNIFAGKTTTLQNLGALVAPYDNATLPWWRSAGYPEPINATNLLYAGGLT